MPGGNGSYRRFSFRPTMNYDLMKARVDIRVLKFQTICLNEPLPWGLWRSRRYQSRFMARIINLLMTNDAFVK